VSYLIETVKILGWVVQSLLNNFDEFYPMDELARLCHCTNLFIMSYIDLLYKFVGKDMSIEEYLLPDRLEIHEFETDLLKETNKCSDSFISYMKKTTDLANKFDHIDKVLEQGKLGRYYLWRAQKKARRIMAQAYQSHKGNSHCLRSMFSLALIAGFDRLLGEQEYLKLNSGQLCEYIKHCSIK
jgi:hypothetical protein